MKSTEILATWTHIHVHGCVDRTYRYRTGTCIEINTGYQYGIAGSHTADTTHDVCTRVPCSNTRVGRYYGAWHAKCITQHDGTAGYWYRCAFYILHWRVSTQAQVVLLPYMWMYTRLSELFWCLHVTIDYFSFCSKVNLLRRPACCCCWILCNTPLPHRGTTCRPRPGSVCQHATATVPLCFFPAGCFPCSGFASWNAVLKQRKHRKRACLRLLAKTFLTQRRVTPKHIAACDGLQSVSTRKHHHRSGRLCPRRVGWHLCLRPRDSKTYW